MTKILIVDDNSSIRRMLSEILETRDYTVHSVARGKACLEIVTQENFDLILLDIKMQGMDGFEVLKELMLRGIDIPIIMMSAHGRSSTAKQVIEKGAFNYIEKPFDIKELIEMIEDALVDESINTPDLEVSNLARKQQTKIGNKTNLRKVDTQNKINSKIYNTGKTSSPTMIGSSPLFMKLKGEIAKVAPTNFRVLIFGPNGSGKELVARSIHDLSPRSNKRFVEVNCAAIPNELIESVLFGHTKGSFTGANKETVGLFQQAEGGTIFLDEIGDMSLSAQAKVLRVLQEHKITKVGGDKEIKINVRVIAATNKNLQELISEKAFREDLFYRLEELVIKVPSLNERRADIPELVNHFVSMITDKGGWIPPKIEKEAMDVLQQLNYAGNIRQLQNIVKRMLVMSEDVISVADVNRFAPLEISRQKEVIQLNNLVEKFGSLDAAITYIREHFNEGQ